MTYYLEGANGDTVYFDGVNYTILQNMISGLSGYPVVYDQITPPGMIGSIMGSVSAVPKIISLQVAVLGNGRTELERKRLKLITTLNPILGESRFYWEQESGETHYLRVWPVEGSPAWDIGTDPNAQIWIAELHLACLDPCWYASSSVTVDVVGTSEGFSLPFQLPFTLGRLTTTTTIKNPGTAPCPVLINLTGKLVAPIELTNETTGETIIIRKSLHSGESLVIDTADENLHVTFTDADGNESNALHYCTVGSAFWSLPPGDTTFTYRVTEEGPDATGTLTYTPRWMAR